MFKQFFAKNVKEQVLQMAIDLGVFNKDGVYPERHIVFDEFGSTGSASRCYFENEYLYGIVEALSDYVAQKPTPLADCRKPDVEQALHTLMCAFENGLK